MYFCPLCTFQFSSVGDVLSHLRLVHSSDPHFVVTCGLDGCAKSATSFSALYSHIRDCGSNLYVGMGVVEMLGRKDIITKLYVNKMDIYGKP